MSATTWTPTALASELVAWQGAGWRAVEAQHEVASLRLARGRLADQALLEEILDASKPPLPEAAAGLHWLLATPFRYRPPPPGSRFRRPHDPGVFYGAEDRETACGEAGFWRLRFWRASEGLAAKQGSLQMTLFEFHGSTARGLDLSRPPLAADRIAWTRPDDYSGTQALADGARQAGVEALRYESVRRPGGICLALLTPEVFRSIAAPYRHNQQTWHLLLDPPGDVVWQRDLERESWAFRFG